MKLLTLIIFLLFLFTACTKDEIHIPQAFSVNIDEEFTLYANDVVRLDINENFYFSFTSLIEESRCPTDVVCVWEGQFIGSFTCPNCVTSTFELTNRAGQENINRYEDLEYEVILLEASPKPVSTGSIALEDYLLRMVIKEL